MLIQKLATEIVQRLQLEGYIAYFAGGWVRDYVMDHPSSDIDIATNAPTQVILDLFPHTILVGLNFGVIIVVLEGHQFEVSTFRRDIDYEGGRRPTRVELATPEEDASRRDFTINGMFYDPITHQIYDYVHGMEDIHKKIIRTIGNPLDRFFEDRLRMIRAVRFAARFNFHLDLETQEAIAAYSDQLFPAVAMERIWQEFEKMSAYRNFDWALTEMHRLNLLQVIFLSLKGVHLQEIKEAVKAFPYFPKNAPTILYLRELFRNATLKEWVEIVQYLKASHRNIDYLEQAERVRSLIEKGGTSQQWAYFLAHPQAMLVSQAVFAHCLLEKQTQILEKIQKLAQDLKDHIQRLIKKEPLVRSQDLKDLGILPGKKMGVLLRQAEEIAINFDLHHKEEVLEKLKYSSHWEACYD